jgi:hypothetical protein
VLGDACFGAHSRDAMQYTSSIAQKQIVNTPVDDGM